jgi:hypothetical protein
MYIGGERSIRTLNECRGTHDRIQNTISSVVQMFNIIFTNPDFINDILKQEGSEIILGPIWDTCDSCFIGYHDIRQVDIPVRQIEG